MQHTLIAVFDNRDDAQSAMTELLTDGFDRAKLRLSEEGGSITDPDTSAGESIGASIKHFFRDLFGDHSEAHAHKYASAIKRGHHVLSVTTSDEADVERAADIVERFGPIDIDEHSAQWAGGAPVSRSDPLRTGGAGGMQGSVAGASFQSQSGQPGNSTGAASGSAQGGMRDGSQQRAESSMDTRGDAALSQKNTIRQESDKDWRNHWDSNYNTNDASYDDYAPAYSFGHEMASMYRGQPWNDVEGELRLDWESRQRSGGSSTWEQFKGAIRHGWERIRR